MKLIHKFTLWYLLTTFFVLMIGGFISYHTTKAEIDREQARYLKKNIDFTIKELSKGIFPDSLLQHKMEIKKMDFNAPVIKFKVSDTLIWHHYLKRMEPQVKVTTSRIINGEHYYIATYGAMVDTDDITEAVIKSISGIFIIMLFVTVCVSFLISKKILSPFNRTLRAMQSFRLQQKSALQLPATHTVEFEKLNNFLKHMTGKAKQDYQTLKEFTENASHELQTPLAIIMGKLELLMESNIDDQQARLITSAHTAVEKLGKMGQSLTLLTKLDNHEFESAGLINFSKLVKESLFAFQELIEMQSLQVEQSITEDVQVNIHPVLSHILLNNLLGNAIRHNVKNGLIQVQLTAEAFEIANTGEPLEVLPSEMFKRFRKGNQSSESIGLGLAIVKQICEQSNIRIDYNYKDGLHNFRLNFGYP